LGRARGLCKLKLGVVGLSKVEKTDEKPDSAEEEAVYMYTFCISFEGTDRYHSVIQARKGLNLYYKTTRMALWSLRRSTLY
jgi:hypothetical protein